MPVIISDSLIDGEAAVLQTPSSGAIVPNPPADPFGTQPLTHARIGYQTYTRNASVSASNNTSLAAGAKNPMTYEWWQSDSATGWWMMDAGVAVDVDYCGIAAHNLEGATVEIQSSPDNSAWTTRASINADSNLAIMALFEAVTARYWRVNITSSVNNPRLGVVYFGEVMQMCRPIYVGHTPANLQRQTVRRPSRTESGNFLGYEIIRKGLSTAADWNNLEPDWYRQIFDPFVVSCRRYPFFFAWRPIDYPDEVAYCWTTDDIAPQNERNNGMMSVSINMQGHQ